MPVVGKATKKSVCYFIVNDRPGWMPRRWRARAHKYSIIFSLEEMIGQRWIPVPYARRIEIPRVLAKDVADILTKLTS